MILPAFENCGFSETRPLPGKVAQEPVPKVLPGFSYMFCIKCKVFIISGVQMTHPSFPCACKSFVCWLFLS